MKKFVTLLIPGLLWFQAGVAQSSFTDNTLKLTEPQPPARISDVAWINGYWTGKAFGGECEEIWSEPLGNSMTGSFKLVKDGKTSFFELLSIIEENQSLILRLKHFGPSLIGWEEKDKAVEFPLVKIEEDKAFFEGMTFQRKDRDHITVFLANEQKDGSVGELVFHYERKK